MASRWKNIPSRYTIEHVGGYLFTTIASDLYRPDEVIREYVQNAVDAYTKYERSVGNASDKSIHIKIDPLNRSVAFYDNGIGMDGADIEIAKAIAVSPKLGDTDNVGFRGIGIWAGLAACERIEIISTKVGSSKRFKFTIFCRDIVTNYTKGMNIGALMEGRHSIAESPARDDEHYTFVKLVNIDEGFTRMLSAVDMTQYISASLPVSIDPEWDHAENLISILDLIPHTQSYHITVNGEPVYRQFPKKVAKPETEILKDKNGKEIAIAWYSRSLGANQITPKPKSNEVVAFAVRVKNFTIGDRLLYDQGKGALLDWFVGDIYITDENVQPDSNRRLFNPDVHGTLAAEAIKQFYELMQAKARAWSSEINALEVVSQVDDQVKLLEGILDRGLSEDAVQIGREQQALQILKSKVARLLKEANSTFGKGKKNTGYADKAFVSSNELKKALRKPIIKNALIQANTKIETIEKRIEIADQTNRFRIANASTENTSQQPTEHDGWSDNDLLLKMPEADGITATQEGKKTKSTSRTANPVGSPITLTDALKVKAGNLFEDGFGISVVDSQSSQTVDLSTALGAFKAAAAWALGERHELFIKIFERLPSELALRGIGEVCE